MLSPSRPSSPTGPAYLAPYLFFYMYCSCLKNGLWTWWSKSFVTWYSLPGLSDSWLFFWLSLSRLTRAASCNTIQMEYSINSKAGRRRQALSTRPPPSSALSLRVLLQQATFCFGCFCCFLQIECLRRQAFVLERIVWETHLVILHVYIDAFVCAANREPGTNKGLFCFAAPELSNRKVRFFTCRF